MELAQAYLPAMTPKAAHRKLQHWIAIYPGLADRLHDMGYRPTERLPRHGTGHRRGAG